MLTKGFSSYLCSHLSRYSQGKMQNWDSLLLCTGGIGIWYLKTGHSFQYFGTFLKYYNESFGIGIPVLYFGTLKKSVDIWRSLRCQMVRQTFMLKPPSLLRRGR